MITTLLGLVLGAVIAVSGTGEMQDSSSIGIFSGHGDVGAVLHPGSVAYDAGPKTYTIAGSGTNMWFASDEFQFVWKKVSGDATLAADIAFVGEGKNAHRKACIVLRQDLDTDSIYADIAVHGDGLTSLQYRDAKGATTHEVRSHETHPHRVRLERRGDYVTISVGGADGQLRPSGGSALIPLQGDYYIGLGVSSHDKDVVETAVFSNVELDEHPAKPEKPVLYSTLETVAIASTDRSVVRVAAEHFEAPNWTPDGASLIYNGGGRLYKIPFTGGTPEPIDTGFATRCNNDHGLSPDGKTIVISDQSQAPHQSIIYTLPVSGGPPTKITEHSPSYWHGWSPDGKTLAYCAQRDGKFGIFTIAASGGEEKRLTTAVSLDDGPDYSPDGKYIYFNSDRTGHMQIWRMGADGSNPEQVTHEDTNDWFAHVSPNGKWMVYLSYAPYVNGHPADKDVTLRLMNLADGKVTFLAKLFGGQGTINVPSWSPDSTRVAFVSYQYLPE